VRSHALAYALVAALANVVGAAAVASRARERLRLAGDAYVVALVGGTGVGKSSLLNALAGEEITAASPRRPTTDHAVAWIPSQWRTELVPVLRWLGVERVREHGAAVETAGAFRRRLDSL
jgi:predicted GTPase